MVSKEMEVFDALPNMTIFVVKFDFIRIIYLL